MSSRFPWKVDTTLMGGSDGGSMSQGAGNSADLFLLYGECKGPEGRMVRSEAVSHGDKL